MIFSVITQSGTKIGTLNNTIYQYSDNLTFQFLRDAKFNEYTLGAYINYDDKIYGLEVSEDDTFKVDSRFLNEKKEFLLSFSLTNGEEIIHLGTINYRVKDAFGSTTSPLPGQKEVWTVLVEQEVDDYFLKNYQSQLDDFNQKYEEIKKIASSGSGGGSNVTVDTALSSTSTNPVQNKVIKTELDKKAAKNEIPTNLSSLNEDETHQTVTADEKKKWDGKSDFDGDFNSLNNIPNIPDAVIVDAELNETSTNAIQNQAVTKELAEKLSKNGLKTINGESLVGSGNIELSAGDNDYKLPIANNEVLGGVMPIAKTAEMSQGVGVDENGRLFTFPGGSGSSEDYRAYKNELIFDDSTNNVSSCVWNLDNIDGFERKGKIFLEIRIETNKNYENAAELNKKAVYLLAFNRHILYHIGTGLSSSYPNWVCGMILEYDVDNNVFEAYMHLSTYGNLDTLYGPSQSNNNYHLISVKEELSFTNISLRMDDAVNLVDGINAIKIKIYKLK